MKPSNIHELKGTYKAHPERKRKYEPKPDVPLGAPPQYLGEREAVLWVKTLKDMAPGTAFVTDTGVLELYCRLYIELIDKGQDFPVSKYSPFLRAMQEMGLTPVSRARLMVIPSDTPKNKFSEL